MRSEFAGLAVNESLWRQAARIEAFKEQEPWIAQLQGQIGELEKEIAGLGAELTAESERLGLGAESVKECGEGDSPIFADTKIGTVPLLPEISAKRLASLRLPAKLVQQARRRLQEARQAAARAADNVHALAEQIETALAEHGQSNLTSALDAAGNLVSQYRRRVQIDERLDQLARHRTELEERSRNCSDRQLLPVNTLVWTWRHVRRRHGAWCWRGSSCRARSPAGSAGDW